MLGAHVGESMNQADHNKIMNASRNLVPLKQVRAYQAMAPKETPNLLEQRQEEQKQEAKMTETLLSHSLSDVLRCNLNIKNAHNGRKKLPK